RVWAALRRRQYRSRYPCAHGVVSRGRQAHLTRTNLLDRRIQMDFTEPLLLTMIMATFFVAGLVKGVVGLGLPIVVLALLATTVGLKTAMALFIVPGVIMNIWQALAGPAFFALLKRLWPLWLVSTIAIYVGTTVLARVDQDSAALAFGALLAAYAFTRLARFKVSIPEQSERWLSPLIGAVAGFIFGATGQYMVPGVLYIEALGLKRDEFVQALGMTFLTITSTLGVGLFANELMTPDVAAISAAAIVPACLGLYLGQSVRARVSEDLFRTLLFIWLGLTGVFIVARSLAS
ncbi:MAG: sulfite exporter TauE/SafE family protein, partial [Pseudomonadota bacterium]